MNYCPNCGEKIKEGADICLGCGKFIKKEEENPMNVAPTKIPGKGKGIASLILGILSAFWAFIMLVGIENGIESFVVNYYYNQTAAYLIGYYIGYTLLSLTPSIVGLCLGIKSNKQNKNNTALAGTILSAISLAVCAIVLIIFIANI